MYDFTTLFSYPVVNGDATYGELVTASKLTDISKRARDNLVEVLADIYRGASGARRSGVLTGLTPTAHPSKAMTVMVGEGCGLYYSNILFATTAVTTGGAEITLADPDTTNPRYDLIVARPNGALGDVGIRQVKLSDGTFSTASKPGRYQEGIFLDKFTGEAAASPTVPTCSLGDIPIAVVLVPAAASPGLIDAGDVYDVRSWLMRTGETIDAVVTATLNGTSAPAGAEMVAPMPGLSLHSFTRSDVGIYLVKIKAPQALGSVVPARILTSFASAANVGGSAPSFVLTEPASYSSGSPMGAFDLWNFVVYVFNSSGAAVDLTGATISVHATFKRND